MSRLSDLVDTGHVGILALLAEARLYVDKGYVANYRMQMGFVKDAIQRLPESEHTMLLRIEYDNVQAYAKTKKAGVK